MTMSISWAPSWMANSISSNLVFKEYWPLRSGYITGLLPPDGINILKMSFKSKNLPVSKFKMRTECMLRKIYNVSKKLYCSKLWAHPALHSPWTKQSFFLCTTVQEFSRGRALRARWDCVFCKLRALRKINYLDNCCGVSLIKVLVKPWKAGCHRCHRDVRGLKFFQPSYGFSHP